VRQRRNFASLIVMDNADTPPALSHLTPDQLQLREALLAGARSPAGKPVDAAYFRALRERVANR